MLASPARAHLDAESTPTPGGPATNQPERPQRSASEAVREGNRLLKERDAAAALQAYDQAEQVAPEERAIAFDRGLAHFDLKQFDEARSAFQEAATNNDDLGRDARYGLATCDHAEALEKTDDPKSSLGLLEGAMRKYQGVLADDPHHQAARSANRKAAAVWQQLKQQLQQQQQQQQESSSGDSEPQDQGEKNEQQQQSEQDDSQPQEQQEAEAEKQAPQEEQEQKQESASDQEKEEPKDPTQASASEEQVSREQAERKLREMMQTLRDRKKARREPAPRAPVAPVEKDW